MVDNKSINKFEIETTKKLDEILKIFNEFNTVKKELEEYKRDYEIVTANNENLLNLIRESMGVVVEEEEKVCIHCKLEKCEVGDTCEKCIKTFKEFGMGEMIIENKKK